MNSCGLVISKNDINTFFQSFIKPKIFDAEWHISLALDFLNITDKDEFKLDDLCNPEYIKDVLNNNKDNDYTKVVLGRKNPEMYISGIFGWYDLYLKDNENNIKNSEKIEKHIIKNNENDKKAQMITRDCDPIHEYGQFIAGTCVGVVIMAVMSFILSL